MLLPALSILNPPPPPTDSRNVEINGKIHRSDKSKKYNHRERVEFRPARVYRDHSQTHHILYIARTTEIYIQCLANRHIAVVWGTIIVYIYDTATFDTLIISNDWFSFRFFFVCSSALEPRAFCCCFKILLLYNSTVHKKRKCKNVKEKQQYGYFSLFDYNGMFELIFCGRVNAVLAGSRR